MANAKKTNTHVDAVIVGSGAAGALVAAKLALKGKKVVILESGRSVLPPDMISSDIHARSLHWGNADAELQLTSPAIRTNFSTGAQTGGTAAHHYAALVPSARRGLSHEVHLRPGQ